MKSIDFYFDFISPFGWIAAERVVKLAAQHNCKIHWLPFLLKTTVVDIMGLKPLLDTPLKGPYILHDAKRQARFYGLTLHDHSEQIFSSIVPARAVVWVRENAPQKIDEFVLAIYRRWMVEGLEIASQDSVLEVARSLGFDIDAMANGLVDPFIKQTLKSDAENMINRGVFGSPTLVVDNELFWGSDRVDHAFAWLEKPW